MSRGGRSGAGLDGRLSVLKEGCGKRARSVSERDHNRNGIGPGSEADRNQIGTASEPDGNRIGNVLLHRWPSKMLKRRYIYRGWSDTGHRRL